MINSALVPVKKLIDRLPARPHAGAMKAIFVTGVARSGTTLLFSLMNSSPSAWSLYREEHAIFEWNVGLRANLDHDTGNVLDESDATAERADAIRSFYWKRLKNPELFGQLAHWRQIAGHGSIAYRRILSHPCVIVDKNPKHLYRIPFLQKVFPDPHFVFIRRAPESNIYSLYEGWLSGRYKTYGLKATDDITGSRLQWSFELPPGWKSWINHGVLAICCFQYAAAKAAIDRATASLDPSRYTVVGYEELIENPTATITMLYEKLGFAPSTLLKSDIVRLPVLNEVTPPSPEKWRVIAREIKETLQKFRDELRIEL